MHRYRPRLKPVSDKSPTLGDCKDFASDLVLMKSRAAELGMWKTMHAIEPATKMVGYELAEMLEGKHPTSIDSGGMLQITAKLKS